MTDKTETGMGGRPTSADVGVNSARCRVAPFGDDPVISYSQNAEDVRLSRAFRDVEHGFYVDVGAADPSEGSVTRLFYDRGWSGINIEPGPYFARLEVERPRDINLQVAIGETEATVPFFVTYPDPGMSTLAPSSYAHVPEAVERIDETTVRQRRLESVLEEFGSGTINFLKIDAEGAEREVLASSNWKRFRPIVVLVEAVAAWSSTPSYGAWEHILTDADYRFAVFDGINRFYVDSRFPELIPLLAYPISALDRYVTADSVQLAERARSAEAAARHARGEALEAGQLRGVVEELEQTIRHLRDALDELRQANASLEQKLAEQSSRSTEQARVEQHLREEIAAIYRSRTWRAGRIVASVGRAPMQILRRRTRPPAALDASPADFYVRATARGEPWHFPGGRARAQANTERSPLSPIIDALGPPREPLDAATAREVLKRVAQTGWTDDRTLLERRFSSAERQVLVEADGLARLVLRAQRPHEPPLHSPDSVVVVDVRPLQDPLHSSRGVGVHGLGILQAVRAVAEGRRLCLLADAELPDLAGDIQGDSDAVVYTPYALRDSHVALFVELSPMTATSATTSIFLRRSGSTAVSIVHDLIPTVHSAAYLTSPTTLLANRVRIEMLRHYDTLLANSVATSEECRKVLGNRPPVVVTGVADPLDMVEAEGFRSRPFVLVPAGGDPRKNAAAAIAALGAHARAITDGRREALEVVVTGTLTVSQESALVKLAADVGIGDDLDVRGHVSDAELAALCAGAEAVVVPSIVEGFSIPVAQAVRRGTPVVASDIPVHRELLGEGPWLAEPEDSDALARALAETLEDRRNITEQQRRALGDMSEPEAVAERVRRALAEVLEGIPSPTIAGQRPPRRPRLALVTPFPPQRSGVADYTEYTFRHVANHADVEVFTHCGDSRGKSPKLHALSGRPYSDDRFDAVVTVVGNSHFHFPVLDLLSAYGGATIAHDNRMFEAYRWDRGDAWTAAMLASAERPVDENELDTFVADLDRLPSIGYSLIARQSSPLIVHGKRLARRIRDETGVDALVNPFVPYNVPSVEAVDAAVIDGARGALKLDPNVAHIATFGIVDIRTKGADRVVAALAWLESWGVPAELHVIGEYARAEQRALLAMVDDLGISGRVRFHGRVERDVLEQYLFAADVAIQLRTSSLLSLSGALADCVAYGVPTVASGDMAEEMDAPPYVVSTPASTSSLLVAESVMQLVNERRARAAEIEAERRDYLRRRSPDAYALRLLAALGLEPAS
jgi:FkbM family methyltransferase